jgi:hypothetical protein
MPPGYPTMGLGCPGCRRSSRGHFTPWKSAFNERGNAVTLRKRRSQVAVEEKG